MKHRIIYIIMGTLIIFLAILNFVPRGNKVTEYKETIRKTGTISMMLETDANSKKYEMTTRNEWPTSEYKFNSKLSKCENGGSVSWDFKNKNVVMEGTTSDKCYIYFDKVVTVSDYCTSGDNLADCIKTFGNEGYDKSNIYIHDDSLKYGAGDNSYRFAGPSDYVNNYVCFGSSEDVCPNNNLYRIIGVFGDQVKLIKADFATSEELGTDGTYIETYDVTKNYLSGNLLPTDLYKGNNLLSDIGVYYWNNTASNTWSDSVLNTTNLNTNYLNNLGKSWKNMISKSSWKVGGNTVDNLVYKPMYEVYQNEIVNPVSTNTIDGKTEYNAKIGLMYVSDFGYAASSKYWTYIGYNASDLTKTFRESRFENWLYLGLQEWTITRQSQSKVLAMGVDQNQYGHHVNEKNGNRTVRPCFYLKTYINYNGGSGTKESPIRLENAKVTLADYIKSEYTGTQGENNIYYHNGTIKSGDTVIDANDGSYRYAGASEDVNNYVCFGSDETVCPTDNLYRIIGVFGDQVKLIKADFATSEALGENGAYYKDFSSSYYSTYKGSLTTVEQYHWNNSTNTNTWSESNLNTINLNDNYIAYLNNQNFKWVNMIAESSWQVGGNIASKIGGIALYNAYQNEITSPSESIIYNAKIGLMYISDYVYSASPTYWTYLGSSSDSSKDYRAAINENWMYMGIGEWSITRRSEYSDIMFSVATMGHVNNALTVNTDYDCVRPTFYLKSTVTYTGNGDGTIESPYQLEF